MESEQQSVTQLTAISLRVIIGAVFIWAGSMKLLDLDSFIRSIGDFKLSPFDEAPWDMWLGYMLPAFEVIAGSALILGFLLRGAMLSLLALSVSFLVVVMTAHSRGLNYECGCFGKALSFQNVTLHISILSLMVLMSIALIMLEISNQRKVRSRVSLKTD